MAQVAFTIPNDQIARLVDAYCGVYGYRPLVIGQDGAAVPNPETRAEFARRMIRQELRYTVEKWERQQADVADLDVT